MAGKRSNGEGYVKQLPSGTWRAQIMAGYTDEGKKKILNFTGPTKSDVLAQVREFKTQQEQGIRLDRSLTFGEWADTWFEGYRTQVQSSTYSGYKHTLKLLKKHFGEDQLKDILPMHVSKYITKLTKDGYSKSLTSKCRAMLIQIFDEAESNMLLPHNPARKSRPIKDFGAYGSEKKKKDAFTPEEVAILFRELSDDLMGHSIRLLILTGLRVQEIIALTADDITEDGSLIDVNKAVKIVDGKADLGLPKSISSTRKIPVPPEGQASVRYLREHSRGVFIWSPSIIRPLYSTGSFRQKYYTALEAIPTVRRLPPYCCRHTYVTLLQARRVPMETIARLTGHTDISITDNYLHISMDSLASAVQVLDVPSTTERNGTNE